MTSSAKQDAPGASFAALKFGDGGREFWFLALSNCRRAMKLRLSILLLCLFPVIAYANPVMIDGTSAIAFSIVAFWALVVESGIVTLTLVSCGILILPAFISLAVANIAVFLFAFLPLNGHVSVWVLEAGVVVADGLLIKIVTAAPFLQGGGFVGVSWRRAFVASLLGNTASFFVGVLAAGAPWIDHKSSGMD